jgi:magnesium transporter
MLTFYGAGQDGPLTTIDGQVPPQANWIDALQPTEEERARLQAIMGVRIPTLAELEEIESSSRLASEGDALIMSLPATTRDAAGFPRATSIGFVLDIDRLLTIRFAPIPSFEHLARQLAAKRALREGGVGAMTDILDMLVDHLADVLERVGDDLETMSSRIFATSFVRGRLAPHRANDQLAAMLREVGTGGELLSKVSQSLLGLNRIIPFLVGKLPPDVAETIRQPLETVSTDVHSLREFADHLSGKTQFLLDALLGLANIQQNNVFRILTVVSVIGIPPTFFASLYGMNFKTMPEYDWHYGYAYGLTVITLSALVPAVWFKLKGWW